MNLLSKIEKRFLPGTFGAVALASLLICAVSGIPLAIPYDVADPFESLKVMMLTNPAGVFFRNLHYWSAQFFLIFTILHFWDHLYRSTENNVKKGIWIRLVVSVFFIFFIMLSGFILKGDADSLQARLIFGSLLATIPGGRWISLGMLGQEGDFQLLYVHHIATATIFIFLVTFEHARTVWPRMKVFLISLGVLLIFSFFFHAPIQTHASGVVKGPWYFLGLQEILHWTSHPWIVLLALLSLMILLIYIQFIPLRKRGLTRNFLAGLFIFYLSLTTVGYFFRGENWAWTWDVSHAYNPFRPAGIYPENFFTSMAQSGEAKEGCLLCHQPMEGFSPSHDPAAIGCSSCHLGNPFAPGKDEAHRSMTRIPGSLQLADRTCGTSECHPDIHFRVMNSIMSTNSGMVSVDRFVFGESDSLSVFSRITEIGHSAADEHLRNLCAHCHLGHDKEDFGPIGELSRGGGCNACHLNYSPEAIMELNTYLASQEPDTFLARKHPSLDINISNEHCFGCHSRSGRISMSYEGWHETMLEAKDLSDSSGYRILADQRVLTYIHEDIHHAAGMTCTDCHISYGVMGDGNTYLHKEEQVMISCDDCHFSVTPTTKNISSIDQESRKILELLGWEDDSILMVAGSGGYPLVNTRIAGDGSAMLILKKTGKVLPMKAPAKICIAGGGHKNLSCGSCHNKWTPQCIGCHNEYDPAADGYDLLANQHIQGSWVEYIGKYLASEPVLGVKEDTATGKKEILTFTPGMVMTIDRASYTGEEGKEIFHRLFAPIEPHTTSSVGHDCKACHLDPLMIGYGRGTLTYDMSGNSGTWIFSPFYAGNKNDGLPEDAWTPFLETNSNLASTRYNHRPFNREEQKRILLAGSCMICHDQDGAMMKEAIRDFDAVLKKRKPSCIRPYWESPAL